MSSHTRDLEFSAIRFSTYIYDERRRKKRKKQDPPNPQFIEDSILSWSEIERRAEEAGALITQWDEEIKPLRKDLKNKLALQSAASIDMNSKKQDVYEALQAAREEVRELRKRLIPLEAALRAKQESYHFNKLLKAKSDTSM